MSIDVVTPTDGGARRCCCDYVTTLLQALIRTLDPRAASAASGGLTQGELLNAKVVGRLDACKFRDLLVDDTGSLRTESSMASTMGLGAAQH
jgi:hypothetical protein